MLSEDTRSSAEYIHHRLNTLPHISAFLSDLKEGLDEAPDTIRDDYKEWASYDDLDAAGRTAIDDDIDELIDYINSGGAPEEYDLNYINNHALELGYEARWSSSNVPVEDRLTKIFILLATGGPAYRAVLDLKADRAYVEAQDWFQPWQQVGPDLSTETYHRLRAIAPTAEEAWI